MTTEIPSCSHYTQHAYVSHINLIFSSSSQHHHDDENLILFTGGLFDNDTAEEMFKAAVRVINNRIQNQNDGTLRELNPGEVE